MTSIPIPPGTPSITDRQAQFFRDLRKLNLKHPGMVKPAVVRILRLDLLTDAQIGAVTMEWLRLHPQKEAAHG